MTRRTIGCSTALLLLSAALPVRADEATDPSGRRLRVSLGGQAVLSAVSAQYTLRSTPALEYGTSTGSSTQRHDWETATGWGGELGLGLDLGRAFGIEARASYARLPLAGPASTYAVSLRYQSRQPPDYTLRTFTYQHDVAWPATEGTLAQWAFDADAVLRVRLGPRVGLRLSAGPSLLRVSGEARSLAYSVFRLGGHSVLFGEDYRLAYSLTGASALGVNGGLALEAELGQRLALWLDLRGRLAGDLELPVRVTEVVNRDEVIWELAPEQAQSGLAPAPVRFNASGIRVAVGMTLRF